MLIAGAAVISGLCWMTILPRLQAADASSGITVLSAGAATVPAVLLLVLAGLPALVLSVLLGSRGNPLGGIFTAAAGLALLAAKGGSIEGWIYRSNAPAGYPLLLVETVLWHLGALGLIALLAAARPRLRRRFPALSSSEPMGSRTSLSMPTQQSLLAAATCALFAAVFCHFLIQTSATGQVIGSLICGFALAAMIAQSLFPQPSASAMLLSPLLVSLAGYGWAMVSYNSPQAFSAAKYSGQLTGLALALPIHYVSAGIAGVALGIGWGTGLTKPHDDAPAAAAGEATR